MGFKIINNLASTDNHFSRLQRCFCEYDEALIASPFLMGDFGNFFSELDSCTVKKLHLVTTLAPGSFEQIKKINSLASLGDIPPIQESRLELTLSIDNKLHGKIYIFKRKNVSKVAIITSANFTDNGMARSHEWGVEIDDETQILQLEEQIQRNIEYSALSLETVYLLRDKANDFLVNNPSKEERKIELSLVDSITYHPLFSLDESVNYWLKPIGYSGAPVEIGRRFDQLEDHLHFSKQRPNEVKPGDIAIAYGVGSTKMLSVYRITSYAQHVTNEEIEEDDWLERWPWYVTAENLTPGYGGIWWNYSLLKNQLKDEYLTLFPNNNITAVGGKTLGALNFGKDKVKLSPHFAQFIIDTIVRINASIRIANTTASASTTP